MGVPSGLRMSPVLAWNDAAAAMTMQEVARTKGTINPMERSKMARPRCFLPHFLRSME